MSEIRFPVQLGDHEVEAAIVDPSSEHTVPDARGCPTCGEDAYFSGCTAPGCNGYGCPNCATGCDLDFVDADEGGRCANALDEDDDEDGEG